MLLLPVRLRPRRPAGPGFSGQLHGLGIYPYENTSLCSPVNKQHVEMVAPPVHLWKRRAAGPRFQVARLPAHARRPRPGDGLKTPPLLDAVAAAACWNHPSADATPQDVTCMPITTQLGFATAELARWQRTAAAHADGR